VHLRIVKPGKVRAFLARIICRTRPRAPDVHLRAPAPERLRDSIADTARPADDQHPFPREIEFRHSFPPPAHPKTRSGHAPLIDFRSPSYRTSSPPAARDGRCATEGSPCDFRAPRPRQSLRLWGEFIIFLRTSPS